MGKGRVHELHPRNLVGCMGFKTRWPPRQQTREEGTLLPFHGSICPMKYDLLVFDLDGTLCDSAPDISASLRRTLVRMGREPISHDRVVEAIGSGVRKLIERTTTPP